MTEPERHVEELLDRYRTGELGAVERQRVEGHLEACETCRAALAALEDFSRTVERAYAAAAAGRALEHEPDWERMQDAIVARTAARPAVRRRSWLARHVPQTAAAVVALVALGVLWQQGIRGPADADRALRSRPAASDRAESPSDRSAASRPGVAEEAAAARTEPELTPDTQPERARSIPDETQPHGRDAAEAPEEGFGNREGARQDAAGARAREPAPAAGKVLEKPEMADAVGRRDDAVSKARLEARADSEVAAEPALLDEVTVTRQERAAPPPELERFQMRARLALSEADSALAADALAHWRDSLAPGTELPPDLRRAAVALADSLAFFLATRP